MTRSRIVPLVLAVLGFVAVLVSDRGPDPGEQICESRCRLHSGYRCRHRAAAAMGHDDDQLRAQVRDRVLDAGDRRCVRDVACDANNEEFAESGVESDFGSDTTVRA